MDNISLIWKISLSVGLGRYVALCFEKCPSATEDNPLLLKISISFEKYSSGSEDTSINWSRKILSIWVSEVLENL